MSTRAPHQLVLAADEWEDLADYPSAICSGIVGDLAHKARGGYHISIEDQPSTNYSVIHPNDKAPPGDWSREYASGIDMNMSKADMVRFYVRCRRVFDNRHNDPRAKYFNAWNVWDGSGSPVRLNFRTGDVQEASEDHTWHTHGEPYRRYANSPAMRVAMISMAKGETIDEYLGEDEAMAFIENQAQFNAAMNVYFGTTRDTNSDGTPDSMIGADALSQGIPSLNATNAPRWVAWKVIADIRSHVVELKALVANGLAAESARDSQEAARDVALKTIVEEILRLSQENTTTATLSPEQFNMLMNTVVAKVVEAGEDAAGQASAKLTQIAEALDNAGEALAAIEPVTPQPQQ